MVVLRIMSLTLAPLSIFPGSATATEAMARGRSRGNHRVTLFYIQGYKLLVQTTHRS